MKRLFVWLASVSICSAQAVSIGPFATEDWVEDKIKEAESVTNGLASVSYVDDVADEIRADFPDVSGFATKAYVDAVSNAIPDSSTFATVEYVNTTSNNLALLMDDLVSEEELRSSVSNIVPAWALVPVPPVIAEVDPAFTNWLATTNVVIDDNVGTFVSNVVPSWALVPIPPVTVEVDPAFTNWLATTNVATVQYVDYQIEDVSHEIAGKQDALVFDEQGRGVGVGWRNDYPWLYVSGTGTNSSYIGFDGAVNAIVTQDGSFYMPQTSGTLVSDSSLATVAFTGYYSDLSDAPYVPNVSKDSDGRLYIEDYDATYYVPESTTYYDEDMSYWCLTLDNDDMYYPLVKGKVINHVPILTFGKGASEVPVPIVKGSYDPFENDPTDFYLTIPAYDPGMSDSATSHVFHVDLGAYVSTNDLGTLLSDKVSLDAIAPLFSTNNVYTNGDFVIYAQHLYECTNYTGTTGWRAADWKQTSVTEILGNLRRILDAINGEDL